MAYSLGYASLTRILGGPSLYLTENLKAWVAVVFAWILLFLVLAFISILGGQAKGEGFALLLP